VEDPDGLRGSSTDWRVFATNVEDPPAGGRIFHAPHGRLAEHRSE
jgi:hypothetical protein